MSLASDAATQKDIDVPCPNEWAMITASDTGATDRIAYPCIHGAGTTHLDAFGHIAFKGRMWNGYPMSLVTKEGGASKNSILAMKNGIVTRAVLYDIPRLKGVPYLEPGTRVFSDDLEAWVELIPFDETRFFVRRVMLSWEEYRRLYGAPMAGARP